MDAKSEDLPEPVAPVIIINSPFLISIFTFFRTDDSLTLLIESFSFSSLFDLSTTSGNDSYRNSASDILIAIFSSFIISLLKCSSIFSSSGDSKYFEILLKEINPSMALDKTKGSSIILSVIMLINASEENIIGELESKPLIPYRVKNTAIGVKLYNETMTVKKMATRNCILRTKELSLFLRLMIIFLYASSHA
ncbi:hypothetical protein WICMUC_002739 [Wickerhamomyces mucosus]|uniref:Uncharacterized protein n=1 Tax=Wickerhamomyces mucosus TaxID=1378264 RepID=A0A9P8PPZ4_9ASCO|nr:hypothetical protein WICMUC_002739 [Wickerhamomyces mucosus]